MTILFAGGEMSAFIPSDSNSGESTQSGQYDSSFARCAIKIGSTGSSDSVYVETPSWASQTELYLHFDLSQTSANVATYNHVSLFDGSTQRFRLRAAYVSGGERTYTLQYLSSGAVWTTIGSSINVSASRAECDLYVNCDVAGSAKLFVAGTERISGSADLSHITGITKAQFHGPQGVYISQVIAADEPTIGWRLSTLRVTGAGSSTAWTGEYTAVDETTYNDADYISSSVADQVETFATTLTGSLTGYSARGYSVTARAKRGGSGPQSFQLALRSGSTNYFSSTIALGVGYSAFCNVWENDPDTTIAFTSTGVTTAQPGVKSIT